MDYNSIYKDYYSSLSKDEKIALKITNYNEIYFPIVTTILLILILIVLVIIAKRVNY